MYSGRGDRMLRREHKEVRIIILDIKPSSTTENVEVEDFIDYLIKNPVDMPKDTKFLSREEAHER